ncbi:MAG: lamin tail domain-containing protein [Prolixibacteraceae bacterium]
MGIKNYIFIFLVVSFGSIESRAQIILNEIMADPSPSAGLPDREYLELFNTGTSEIHLKGWMLGLGSKMKVFPDVTVAPGEYLLVTATGGAKDLLPYGRVTEISGFLISNSGQVITLSDPLLKWSDAIEYQPSLHKKGFGEGGFSLEKIDPARLCGQRENWATTLSAIGGTPGKENSVHASNPDHLPPRILATSLADHSRLDIQLNESFLLPVSLLGQFSNLSSGLVVDSVHGDAEACLLQLYFHPSTVKNGVSYSVTLHDIKDECGNLMTSQTIRFGYYLPVKSDLLISEVLFNPYPEGADFVEIFNNSGHPVDLSGLSLATRDGSNKLIQFSQISSLQQYLETGEYLAVSKSLEGIGRFYSTKCNACLLQMEKFPGMSDLNGCVVLLDSNGEIIDEMAYTDGMHDPLITETEGVSLERISYSASSSQQKNWHSASRSAGFATPGYKNSVCELADSSGRTVFIDPVVFSPNGDGFRDQLNIYLFTEVPGCLLNITILNCAGRVVRKLANNFTSGSSDQIIWDGLDADFQKVQPGIYILDISIFEQTGKRKSERLACVLTDSP